MLLRSIPRFLAPLVLAATLPSCSITSAPTKVTSAPTEGTSASTESTTDATSGSTSPKEKAAKEQSVQQFVSSNFDRLQEDMAVGQGEHLGNLADLLGITKKQRGNFFALAKQKYPAWFATETTTPDQLLSRIYADLAKHPELYR